MIILLELLSNKEVRDTPPINKYSLTLINDSPQITPNTIGQDLGYTLVQGFAARNRPKISHFSN